MPLATLHERKQQVVRDAIWDAAIQLFLEKGFDETTVEDIARAAGVSRRSFFRYFSSKSDLMAQGIVDYVQSVTDAIDECPPGSSLAEVFREAVLRVARISAAHPRTREIMQIAARYASAREAQLSRLAELQEQIAEAYARRTRAAGENEIMPGVLAGLTLSVLAVTFRCWFEQGKPDIAPVADQVFATLNRVICPGGK